MPGIFLRSTWITLAASASAHSLDGMPVAAVHIVGEVLDGALKISGSLSLAILHAAFNAELASRTLAMLLYFCSICRLASLFTQK